MNSNLVGKNALVGGSTQGIGFAAAQELALLGATVTLIARNEERLKTALEKLDHSRGQAHAYLVADFTDRSSVGNALDTLARKTSPIHIVVNNTGGPSGGPLLEAPTTQLLETFEMHLINYQLIAQALVPGMQAAGFGRIVNIISTSVKQPIPGLGVSNTVRWAVASWAKTLANELGPYGITVNNVLPGYTKTARLDAVIQMRSAAQGLSAEETGRQLAATIPTRRFAEPEEVAAAIAFLCTPAAGSINGINLPVDGGNTASL